MSLLTAPLWCWLAVERKYDRCCTIEKGKANIALDRSAVVLDRSREQNLIASTKSRTEGWIAIPEYVLMTCLKSSWIYKATPPGQESQRKLHLSVTL